MTALSGRTIFITGASRGIGRAIALRAAAEGANLVLAAKTVDDSNQKLKGTIHDVARAVEAAGGKALALQLDVRDDARVAEVVEQAAGRFGGIDALINNAGAIQLTPVESTPARRFDLMHGVNVRASYVCAQACLPWLKKSTNAHILQLSPPLRLEPEWVIGRTAYTISKYGMTLLTVGLAGELADYGIAVNSLWPRTAIATAAVEWLGGEPLIKRSRKPEIVADAACMIIATPPGELTGQALIDEEFLRERGVEDFDHYAYAPGEPLLCDLYVGDRPTF